jgi:excisionase family DNA binding protein
MTLAERLRALAHALPSEESSVTFTRSDLLTLAEGSGQTAPASTRDLTVENVAEEVGRAPSTVRGWLIEGQLQGYKLNGRDWRVTRDGLRAYLDAQREAADLSSGQEETEDVDISAWRRVRRGT